MKLKYLENYLIILMSIVATICIYLLYRPSDDQNSNSQVIARVIGRINIVKKKRDFFQSWKDTGNGDGLSSNDEIYTHGSSFATIQFNNGNKVEISENSLIKIKNNLTNNTLELSKGNIIAELNKNQKNIEIEIKGKKYNLSSENAKIQIEQNANENKFILLEGVAAIKSGKINSRINVNEVLKVNTQTGAFETKMSAANLIFPKRKSTIYFNHSKSIQFSWNKLQNNINTIIISSDREFKNILFEKQTNENSILVDFTTEQTLFWKITSPQFSDSPINEFKLEKYPEIIARLDQNIFISHLNQHQKVFITWDKISNIKNLKYTLNITKPNNEIFEIVTDKNNYQLPLDLLGNYQIKIKLDNQELFPEATFGPVNTITLKNIDKFLIEALTPLNIEKVWYKNTPSKTRINWISNLKVDSYTIKVKTPDQKSYEKILANNFFEIEHQANGLYEWEVIGKIGETKSNLIHGKISFKKPIKVNQQPSKGAIVELQKPDQNVNFKWESSASQQFTQYEIEISKDENFLESSIKQTVNENSFSTALNQMGIYYWRVKILNGNKVEYSEPTSIELRPIPPLQKPEQIPELKIKLNDETQSSFIKNIFHFFIESAYADSKIKKAAWSVPHNPRVKTYVVKIFSDSKGLNLIKTIQSNDSHFTWSDSKPGIYYWSLSYVDFFDRQTDFSNLSKMEIFEEVMAKESQKVQKETIKNTLANEIPFNQKKISNITKTQKEEQKNPDPTNIAFINKKEVYYQILFTPQLYSVKKDETKKIEIDGINIESLEFSKKIHSLITNYDDSFFQIKFNRGKVFSNIIFNDLELKLKFEKDMAIYKHGPFAFTSKNSYFKVINNSVQAENQLNFIIGYLGFYQLGNIDIEAALGYGTGLYLSLEGQYHINEKYTLGLFFQNKEKDNQVNQYLGLKFGYNFFNE